MVFLFALAAVVTTYLGGLFALKKKDELHLILGFSAGAVIAVAFFDLLPEAFEMSSGTYGYATVAQTVAAGFLALMLLSRFLVHPHVDEGGEYDHDHDVKEAAEGRVGVIGASSLSLHSFLDGVGIGLAFQVSGEMGIVVAVAVLAHDFSDGINTVSFILKHKGNRLQALRWLAVDAIAPLLGVLATRFFTLEDTQLGLLLAVFCGFFLYIGASDLLPESQHRHPKFITSVMTLLGALVIFLAIRIAGL